VRQQQTEGRENTEGVPLFAVIISQSVLHGWKTRHVGKTINYTKVYLDNLNGRYDLGDLGSKNKIRVKFMLKKQDVSIWIGFIWYGISSGEFFGYGNEFGFHKRERIF
jgi:hypothetical protein